jgi:hypothetical protein
MNSEKLVKAALHFDSPERVPIFDGVRGDICPLLVMPSREWQPGWAEGEEGLFPHVRQAFKWNKPEWAKKNLLYEGEKWRNLPHEEIDEFGCIWTKRGCDDNMGHPGRPPISKWDVYDDFILKYNPDPMDESRYEFAMELKKSFGENKYRMGHIADFGPFQRASTIRGFTRFLIDHKKHPEEVKKALERETNWHIGAMKACFKYGLNPHGFWIVDDLGEQTGPFFSPKTFEQFYKSVYKTLCDEAHQMGAEVHLHCCGKIDKLLPSLIEWGLDSIELDSPRMSGYPDLAPYKGQIMFWGCVNIQSIYTHGTPEEVEREVWHMVRNLGIKTGGFGAYFYPTPTDIKANMENIKAFKKGLKKYGTYHDIPADWWNSPIPSCWNDGIHDIVPPLPPRTVI